jgi:hypothetical protein
VLTAVLVASLLALQTSGSGEVAETPSSASPSSPAATHEPSDGAETGTFKILARDSAGTPIEWDKCEITYRLLLQGAPSFARTDVEEAVRRLEEATGFDLLHVVDGNEPPYEAIVRMDRALDTEGADIVFAWLPHDRYQAIVEELNVRRRSIAFASPYYEGAGVFSSWEGVVIVLDLRWTNRPGFGGWWSHGMTVLHELGHAVGLGHVKDRDQVMYSGNHPKVGVNDWGAGDLAGLEVVGAPGSCQQ